MHTTITRTVASINLDALMRQEKLSNRRVGKKAEVSPQTVANVRQAAHGTQIDTLDDIAKAIGLSTWMLFLPGLPLSREELARLKILVQDYLAAQDDGRKYIEATAAREAARSTRKPITDLPASA